jgi:uncharacterized membrane protein SpoIIM required for sporulation
MKVAELLERRRQNWLELERLCDRMAQRDTSPVDAATTARFAAVYRSVCADLALADAYQLPQNTVQYLHRLVGRAHNQLYRSGRFDFARWIHVLFFEVPQTIFQDRCVQAAFVLFWGTFILSAWLAYSKSAWPEYAEKLLGSQIEQLEENYKNPIGGRDGDQNFRMAAFYIQNNTGIGLQCFSWGILLIPGLLVTFFNAAFLGAAFGYMARPDVPEGANFFHFVTAHGPFELTAIVLSAGAGLRIGLGWIYTNGLSRIASLQKTARGAMPIMVSAIVMFFAAALIEGFLSPSAAPYWLKAGVAILSSGILSFYFLVLGFPRGGFDATG